MVARQKERASQRRVRGGFAEVSRRVRRGGCGGGSCGRCRVGAWKNETGSPSCGRIMSWETTADMRDEAAGPEKALRTQGVVVQSPALLRHTSGDPASSDCQTISMAANVLLKLVDTSPAQAKPSGHGGEAPPRGASAQPIPCAAGSASFTRS